MAATSAATVSIGSIVFSNAGSWSSTKSSAPIASGFLMTSSAKSVPYDSTVMCVPSIASLMRSAASTACSSKPLTTGAMLDAAATRLPSMRNADSGVSGSSTCLAITTMWSAKKTASRGESRCLALDAANGGTCGC